MTCIHAGEAMILVQVLKKDGTHGKFELAVLNQNTANVNFEGYILHLRSLCKTRVTLNLFQGLLQKIDILAFKDYVVTDAETPNIRGTPSSA